MSAEPVLVVGAGISGIACARELRAAGIPVRVVDRGRRPGGRMASRSLGGETGQARPTDLGAAYFTVEAGSDFAGVVGDWVARDLARPWTDTLGVAGPEGIRDSTTGPMRYAARGGLRGLVADLAASAGIEVEQGTVVETVARDGVAADEVAADGVAATVLAMPDPQARRLIGEEAGSAALAVRERLDDGRGWEPVISVALGWSSRHWSPELHAWFVNDSAELSLVADDGDRRGDGAAVLVAHTSGELARAHLDSPDGAIGPVVRAVARLLDIAEAPEWTHAHRWTFARPARQHPEPFLLEDTDGGLLGVCGDAWGPKASAGTAFASGAALGRELAARLSASSVRL